MKKILLLTAVGVLQATPANSVQRCANNGALSWGSPRGARAVDWSVDQDDEKGFPFEGIGVCTNFEPDAGKYKNFVSVASSASVQYARQCWCKLISPLESKWIWSTTYTDWATCVNNCADYCANDQTYRTYLNNLMD